MLMRQHYQKTERDQRADAEHDVVEKSALQSRKHALYTHQRQAETNHHCQCLRGVAQLDLIDVGLGIEEVLQWQMACGAIEHSSQDQSEKSKQQQAVGDNLLKSLPVFPRAMMGDFIEETTADTKIEETQKADQAGKRHPYSEPRRSKIGDRQGNADIKHQK